MYLMTTQHIARAPAPVRNLQRATPKDTDAMRKHIIMNLGEIPHGKCRLQGKLNPNSKD